MAKIVGGFIGLLILIYILQVIHGFILNRKVSKATSVYVTETAKMAQIRARYPRGTVNEQLRAEIQANNSKIATQKTLLDALRKEVCAI